ncbi:MAG: hypothetical protein M3375_00225 [Actinomycetota bacterium]|nr:hypothetical protein [Actinomycetota bacterium]
MSSTAGAATGDCASSSGCTEDAQTARAFTESVGVNTHIGYDDSAYGQSWPMVRDRLVELGVRHIRDASHRDGTRLSDVVPRYNELAGLGIRGNLLAGDPLRRYGSGTIDQHLSWVKRNVAGFTESLEGPNEYDYPAVDSDWAANLRAYQCEWARQVRADPDLSAKPVIGPSSRSGKGFDSALGDLTACLDRGNLHPYPGDHSPNRTNFGDLSISTTDARSTSGNKPVWATESGYHNAVKCSGCGHLPVSETAAGAYLPRMFMENFRRGIPRTYSYELIDGWPDPEKDEPERNFGLLRNDGSRKPGFVAIRNLLSILADTGAASGRLSYSLRCTSCPVALRHVLLRKSTGAYYLVVWPESSIWDRATRTDIASSRQYADLTIASPLSKLELLDPAQSTTPSYTSASRSHRIPLSDRLSVIRITPPSSSPKAPPSSPKAPSSSPKAPSPSAATTPTSTPRSSCSGRIARRGSRVDSALAWTAVRTARRLTAMGLRGLERRRAVRVLARAAKSGRYTIQLGIRGKVAQGGRSFANKGTRRVVLRLRPRVRLVRRASHLRTRLRVTFIGKSGKARSVSRCVTVAR